MLSAGVCVSSVFSSRRPPGLCCPQTWRKDAPSGHPEPAGCPTLAARWIWPPAPGLPDDTHRRLNDTFNSLKLNKLALKLETTLVQLLIFTSQLQWLQQEM